MPLNYYTGEPFMHSTPAQLFSNLAGPEASFKAFCGTVGKDGETCEGFESVLKGILGGTGLNSNIQMGVNQKTVSGFTNVTIDKDISVLENIFKKLSALFDNDLQGMDNTGVKKLLSGILTEDEISVLNNFLHDFKLNTDFSEFKTFSDVHMQNGSANSLLDKIDDLVAALDRMMEKLSMSVATLNQNETKQMLDGADNKKDILALLALLKEKLQQVRGMLAGVKEGEKGDKFDQVADKHSEAARSNADSQNLTGKDNIISKSAVQVSTNKTGDGKKSSEKSGGIKNISELFSVSKNSPGDGISERLASVSRSPFNVLDDSGSSAISKKLLIDNNMAEQLFKRFTKTASDADTVARVVGSDLVTALKQNAGLKHGVESKSRLRLLTVMDKESGMNMSQALSDEMKSEVAGKVAFKGQINQSAVIEQITGRISIGLKQGETKLTLQLYPPELGKLNIDLSMKNNQLHAVIIAESGQAKQLLEHNIEQLRTCLESNNIDVEKISVLAGQDNRQFASHTRDQSGRSSKNMNLKNDGDQSGIASEIDSLNNMNIHAPQSGSDMLDLFA